MEINIIMPTYGKKLLDNNGNTILPKTRTNLIYHGSTLLSTKINTIDTEISNIKNGTTKVDTAIRVKDADLTNTYRIFANNTTDGSQVTFWNDQLGRAVPYVKAIADQNGNEISSTYLKRSGGYVTGVVKTNESTADMEYRFRNSRVMTSAGANVSSNGMLFYRM